jgi:hypothetical protein
MQIWRISGQQKRQALLHKIYTKTSVFSSLLQKKEVNARGKPAMEKWYTSSLYATTSQIWTRHHHFVKFWSHPTLWIQSIRPWEELPPCRAKAAATGKNSTLGVTTTTLIVSAWEMDHYLVSTLLLFSWSALCGGCGPWSYHDLFCWLFGRLLIDYFLVYSS